MSITGAKTRTSVGRFAVSESGMRELNADREPWDLVKELIQNAWDEAPFASECRVSVAPQADGNTTMVTVCDDGPGFSDIADAYTLMGHTGKCLQPTKRGRFNMGEKDVVSVAIEAEVETVRHTVNFPRTGSRDLTSNSRAKGTVVRILMPWNKKQSGELVKMLRRFRPPINCKLFVNDGEVPHQPAKAISTPHTADRGSRCPRRSHAEYTTSNRTIHCRAARRQRQGMALRDGNTGAGYRLSMGR